MNMNRPERRRAGTARLGVALAALAVTAALALPSPLSAVGGAGASGGGSSAPRSLSASASPAEAASPAAEAAATPQPLLQPMPAARKEANTPAPHEAGAPAELRRFAEETAAKLAMDEPFRAWQGATFGYHPLGPGSHGWLVLVKNGEVQHGYMVISVSEQGAYTLSEYGAGIDNLPYSLNDLRRFLAQHGLIATLSEPFEYSACYAPMLPYWRVKLAGETFYISALDPEWLPWDGQREAQALAGTISGAIVQEPSAAATPSVPAPALLAEGQDGTATPPQNLQAGPASDLLWLTAAPLPELPATDAAAELAAQTPFFRSAGKNDLYAAPFALSGGQLWAAPQGAEAQVYAAAVTPAGALRFLPLRTVQAAGTLQALPGADAAP